MLQIHTFNSRNTYRPNDLQGTIMPAAKKAEWLIRYAFSRPDQVDIWIQVCLHILWNEQTDHSFMLLILPLVRKGRRFFICAKAMSHAQTG